MSTCVFVYRQALVSPRYKAEGCVLTIGNIFFRKVSGDTIGRMSLYARWRGSSGDSNALKSYPVKAQGTVVSGNDVGHTQARSNHTHTPNPLKPIMSSVRDIISCLKSTCSSGKRQSLELVYNNRNIVYYLQSSVRCGRQVLAPFGDKLVAFTRKHVNKLLKVHVLTKLQPVE